MKYFFETLHFLGENEPKIMVIPLKCGILSLQIRHNVFGNCLQSYIYLRCEQKKCPKFDSFYSPF